MNTRTHHGFTLVELLVVIAIIGILIGITLPAVQLSRESARRVSCLSRIGQVGTAVLNYELANGYFPVGTIEPSGGPIENTPTGKHVGWIAQILPHLGESGTASHLDLDQGVYAPVNDPVRRIGLVTLTCPSDPSPRGQSLSTHSRPGSNYAGCHNGTESSIDADNDGMFILGSAVTASDVTDGLGNTILLGEKGIDQDDLGWLSGTRATLRNTGTSLQPPARRTAQEREKQRGREPAFVWVKEAPSDAEVAAQDEPRDAPATPPVPRLSIHEDPAVRQYVGGFQSEHLTVVNFVLADGSAHGISRTIDANVLRQLGSRNDGELLTGGPSRVAR